MAHCRILVFAGTLLLLDGTFGLGQNLNSDTAFLETARRGTIEFYRRAIAGQSRLINGSDYPEYQPWGEEHPYFAQDDWIQGSVFYDGSLFENIPLLYDIHRGLVITEHPLRGSKIQLIPEKLDFFSIHGHRFVRLESRSNAENMSGFYDVLYDGGTKIYVRRVKQFREIVRSITPVRVFDEISIYYILKDGMFHQVKSRRSVMRVLADRKREVKQFLSHHGIYFHDNNENAITESVKYYDGLR